MSEFVPGQACTGHLAVPGGVIHPAHRAWVMGCLEMTDIQMREAPLDFTPQRLRELLELSHSPLAQRLRADGVEPTSLVLTRVPVFIRADEPHHQGNPIRSPEYAAWHQFARACAYLETWQEKLPPVIVDSKMVELQADFDRLLCQLRTGHALFQPLDERDALVGLPPPPRIWWDDPIKPISVALSGTTVLLHLAHTVVQVSLESGAFSVTPVGFAQLVRMERDHAIFQLDQEASLAVYDLHEQRFVVKPRALPRHMVRQVCCGVELWNVAERTFAIMPNGGIDAEEVTISGCGDYGWLTLAPEEDDLGVFSITEARSVFQPWPHPVIERRRAGGDVKDDLEVRALGRTSLGEFIFFYCGWLCTSAEMFEVTDVRAAGFDDRAERFVCVGERALRVLNLATGEWNCWSLDVLFAHLQGSTLLEGIDLDERTLMGTVGSVSALAAMSSATLAEQFRERSLDAPTERELRTLIGRAQQIPLQWRLHRLIDPSALG